MIYLFLSGLVAECFYQINPDAKRDYIWVLGNGRIESVYTGGLNFDFNYEPMIYGSFSHGLNMGVGNSVICNEEGDLLFFTNGMYVGDRNGDIMPHGDSLNFGYWYQQYDSVNQGYRIFFSSVIIKDPGCDSIYYIFHMHGNDDGLNVDKLLMTKVSMTRNNGLGDVISKNNCVIEDSLGQGGLSAIRHSNNNDWWLFFGEANQSKYFRILIDPEGIHIFDKLNIGFVIPNRDCVSAFSPDGTKFAFISDLPTNPNTQLSFHPAGVFDFDRSTGLLSNYRDISFLDSNTWVYGCSFSPNSRFLYAPLGKRLYQWDLQDSFNPNFEATVVATWDGFRYMNIVPTMFGFIHGAPDGKIYITSATPYFHIINQPDMPGTLCEVIQRAITLPKINYGAPPNVPNYRIGYPQGVDETNIPASGLCNITVIPNPAHEWVRFETDIANNNKPMEFQILSLLGSVIHKEYFAPYQGLVRYNVSSLPSGIYFAVLKKNNTIVAKGKFVVEK